MDAMRDAIGLLTRLPVAVAGTERPGAAAFGVVGAAVGALGAVPLALLAGPGGEPWLGALAAIATVAVVTGALRLDGLADTADALLARDPVTAERARTDPSLGVGGAVAILLAIGAEVAALVSIVAAAGVVAAGSVFIAVTALSRTIPVVAIRTMRARAATDGLGGWFGASVSSADAIVAAGTAVLVLAAALAVGGTGPALAAAAIVELAVGVAATAAIAASRGVLDGDGFGAAIEISIVAGLTATAILAV